MAAPFTAYEQVPVAAHVHTRFSDGSNRLSRQVALAQAAGYRGVWITDHADLQVEYPILGTTIGIHTHSLRESGFDRYLRACQHVQARNPEMIIIPGFEASPYYYWRGSLRGKAVFHGWFKHLIVAGIEDARVFRRLPMMAYRTSPFRPGFNDAGEEPYRLFADAVQRAGGLVYWTHPLEEGETRQWRNIYYAVTPYAESLLTVPATNGISGNSVEDAVTAPGGVWDRALAQYVAGERALLPGVLAELDDHRGNFQDRRTLVLLISRDDADRKRAALEALRAGRYYVTGARSNALQLTDFTLTTSGASAIPGETLTQARPHAVHYSIISENPIQWVRLIQNGTVVAERTELSGVWTDDEAPAAGWYRLAVQDTHRRYLLSQPICFSSRPIAPAPEGD